MGEIECLIRVPYRGLAPRESPTLDSKSGGGGGCIHIIHPYYTHIVNNDLNYITECAYPHFIGESQSVWYLLVVRFVCVIRVSVPCVSRLHRGSRDPKFRKIETSRDPAMERNHRNHLLPPPPAD